MAERMWQKAKPAPRYVVTFPTGEDVTLNEDLFRDPATWHAKIAPIDLALRTAMVPRLKDVVDPECVAIHSHKHGASTDDMLSIMRPYAD